MGERERERKRDSLFSLSLFLFFITFSLVGFRHGILFGPWGLVSIASVTNIRQVLRATWIFLNRWIDRTAISWRLRGVVPASLHTLIFTRKHG